MNDINEVTNDDKFEDIIRNNSSSTSDENITETSKSSNISTGQIEGNTEETGTSEVDNREGETGYNNTDSTQGGEVVDTNNTGNGQIYDDNATETENTSTFTNGGELTNGEESDTEITDENAQQQNNDSSVIDDNETNITDTNNDDVIDSGSNSSNGGGEEENITTSGENSEDSNNTGENGQNSDDTNTSSDSDIINNNDDDSNNSSDDNNDNGDDDDLYTGKQIKIKNTPVYMRWFSKTPQFTKSGTYYIYNDIQKSGRIRICNDIGACMVNGRVTGWVNISDIIDNKSIKVGDKVVVTGNITVMADGSGNKVLKNGEIMYVSDILEDKVQFPNYIGVSSSYTSGRQGWGNDEIISKYVDTDVVRHE